MLKFIARTYKGEFWNALPKDVARFWRKKMVKAGRQISAESVRLEEYRRLRAEAKSSDTICSKKY